MHFYFHTFYLFAHQIILQMYNMQNSSLLMKNVILHYFSWYYHASNSAMQGTWFLLIYESVSPKSEQSSVWITRGFLVFLSALSKSKGAWYSEWNNAHRKCIYIAWTGGCCFTRCFVLLMEPDCQSFFFFFANNDQGGWLPCMSWHQWSKQIWLVARLSLIHFMRGFWLPVPVEFWCLSVLPSVHWVAWVSSASSCSEL